MITRLDGTGDDLTTASSSDFAYGTGDFTWEAWIYVTVANANHYLLDHGSNGGTMNIANTKIRYYTTTTGTGSALYTTGGTITYDAWHHVAFVRSSGTTTIYVNGVVGSSASDTHNYGTQAVTVGDYGSGGYNYQGYVADLRIVKGTAIYTSAFTPPTAPVSHTTDTVLLMNNQDANIYDATGANGMILFDNVVSSTAQRKWSGSSAIYFPGDDASIHMDPGESVMDWAILDYAGFTLEGWFYCLSGGDSYYCIIDSRTSSTNGFLWSFASNGKRNYLYHNGSWKYQASSDEISYNTWTHVALTAKRNATTKIWVGGTPVASFTAGDSALLGSGLINWGDVSYTPRDNGVNVFKGYWQDLRITRGFKYTTAFTPPTGLSLESKNLMVPSASALIVAAPMLKVLLLKNKSFHL
jgi:hypothetical protein